MVTVQFQAGMAGEVWHQALLLLQSGASSLASLYTLEDRTGVLARHSQVVSAEEVRYLKMHHSKDLKIVMTRSLGKVSLFSTKSTHLINDTFP